MQIAIKTLRAIDAALEKDQGATFRKLLRNLMPKAEDAYRADDGGFRSHLGASMIGRECARELWYSFHWTLLPKFEGRMIRLFNRGHLEEPRMVALLEMIGCTVYQFDNFGKQYRMYGHSNHYAGSLDGVALGCPDLPEGTPCLVEFKTHGEKSFLKLGSEGVLKAKWEHFIQMQQYMGAHRLLYSLYAAVSKNTDALHLEIVEFDQALYDRYFQRAGHIIEATEPPPKISELPSFFKCKFCDYHKVCHGPDLPAKNCRTCIHSQIVEDGWECGVSGGKLNKEAQELGCQSHHFRKCFEE